jgi:conjugal transfer mating pair stabilization protein TraG
MEELSRSLSQDASFAETHGMQLSENMSQDLAQWYRHQQALHPNMDAPEFWATDVSDQQRAVRGEMIGQWAREKRDAVWSEIKSDLPEPDLVNVSRPGVDSSADVRDSYHPRGVSPVEGGPNLGDPQAAGRAISAGKTQIDDDRAAADAARTLRAEGAIDIQSRVAKDQSVGFFTDPTLRE